MFDIPPKITWLEMYQTVQGWNQHENPIQVGTKSQTDLYRPHTELNCTILPGTTQN